MWNCYLDVCLHNSLVHWANGVVICTNGIQININMSETRQVLLRKFEHKPGVKHLAKIYMDFENTVITAFERICGDDERLVGHHHASHINSVELNNINVV